VTYDEIPSPKELIFYTLHSLPKRIMNMFWRVIEKESWFEDIYYVAALATPLLTL
jgi:hypothetical protein